MYYVGYVLFVLTYLLGLFSCSTMVYMCLMSRSDQMFLCHGRRSMRGWIVVVVVIMVVSMYICLW